MWVWQTHTRAYTRGQTGANLCEVNREAMCVPHGKCVLTIYVLLALGLGGFCSFLEAGNTLVQRPVEAHLFFTANSCMISMQHS